MELMPNVNSGVTLVSVSLSAQVASSFLLTAVDISVQGFQSPDRRQVDPDSTHTLCHEYNTLLGVTFNNLCIVNVEFMHSP